MYEVEIKVRAEHGPVRERLADLGAEPLGAVVQTDTYYDHVAPDRSFADTDEALRVRRERSRDPDPDGDRAAITYKGPKVDEETKTRVEHETTVGDAETAGALFEALDYEAAATVRKERERYAVEDAVVTMDSVDGLGAFVEVEVDVDVEGDAAAEAGDGGTADGSDGDPGPVESARRRAFDLLDRLGLDRADSVRDSYLELLAETETEE